MEILLLFSDDGVPSVSPVTSKMAELLDDLLEVIGTYSVPSTTYRIITLGPDLSARTAYRPSFWRRKIVYERRGLIFDDAVVRANRASYHTYYRLINTREYGMANFYETGGLSGPIASGVTGLGVYNGGQGIGQVALIFPDRVTVVPLISRTAIDDRKGVDIPISGVVASLYRGMLWLFLTERGEIYGHDHDGDVSAWGPVPMVEITMYGPGDFLGRDGEIYRFEWGEPIRRLSVRHTRPFVLRGGINVEGFETNGAAVNLERSETYDIPITVALPPREYTETLLLNGDTRSFGGRVTEEKVPVCRIFGELVHKLTVDGVLRGPEGLIEDVLDASTDEDVTVILDSHPRSI